MHKTEIPFLHRRIGRGLPTRFSLPLQTWKLPEMNFIGPYMMLLKATGSYHQNLSLILIKHFRNMIQLVSRERRRKKDTWCVCN